MHMYHPARLLLVAALLAACGASHPAAEQIVGRWENTLKQGHLIEFRADGSYAERYPSGSRHVGTYVLAEDGGRITMNGAAGGLASGPLRFDGDTLVLLGTPFRKAPADRAAERTTAAPGLPPTALARPRSTSASAPQRAPQPSPSISSVQAGAPTRAPASAPPSPTTTPIHAVVATPKPRQAATAPNELRFRATDPEDHYVAIREQPTTKSREVGRLAPGDTIVCTATVAGETLTYLGQQSNRWAVCPSVGGHIFLPLLIPMRGTP